MSRRSQFNNSSENSIRALSFVRSQACSSKDTIGKIIDEKTESGNTVDEQSEKDQDPIAIICICINNSMRMMHLLESLGEHLKEKKIGWKSSMEVENDLEQGFDHFETNCKKNHKPDSSSGSESSEKVNEKGQDQENENYEDGDGHENENENVESETDEEIGEEVEKGSSFFRGHEEYSQDENEEWLDAILECHENSLLSVVNMAMEVLVSFILTDIESQLMVKVGTTEWIANSEIANGIIVTLK